MSDPPGFAYDGDMGFTWAKDTGILYPDLLATVLKPLITRSEIVLDLFAGCGGLALGFESAGFRTIGLEANVDCCDSYNRNLEGTCQESHITIDTKFPLADIVIGGPPCQPFSVGGRQLGFQDTRNGFPAFVAAVQNLMPRVWMLENVRGLLYKNRQYLEEIIQKLQTFGYVVELRLLNAVDYNVPQNRERLIVVGHHGGYRFPQESGQTFNVGEALGSLLFEEPADGKYLTPSMDRYVENYERASKCVNPRDLNPTKPSRTVTCRNLAGATGDMQRIKVPSGRRRRLTVREGARLQSFPDWFEFRGNEASQFKQIGNAVPPLFANALAASVVDYLDHIDDQSSDNLRYPQWMPLFSESGPSNG